MTTPTNVTTPTAHIFPPSARSTRFVRTCTFMLAGLLAPVLVGALPGCASDPHQGYSFSDPHAQDVRTVAVPIFVNQTYSSGIEAELTDAIVKEIQRSTKWSVVSGSAADCTLSGTLTGMELRRLSVQRDTGYVQEMAIQLRADFEFRDNRSGKVVTSRRGFEAVDTFVPARPTGERIEVGQAGATQRLARAIVAELRSAW